MAATSSARGLYRPLIILGGVVLITASLYLAQRVLIPLALAVLLSFMLSPAVASLQRLGLWRVPSVIIVVLFAFFVLGGVGWALVLQTDRRVAELPRYRNNIAQKVDGLRAMAQGRSVGEVQDMIREIAKGDGRGDPNGDGWTPDPPVLRVEAGSAYGLEKFAGSAFELLASVALVIVLTVFMLIEREDLRNRVVRLLGHGRLIATTRAFDEGDQRLSRFLIMQLVINAGFGFVLGFGLLLIGVRYALLWAILATLLRFLPYVGTVVTTALVVVFSIAVFPGWTQPLLVIALLATLEVAVANIVEPLLFGHSTGISPVALLIAAAFWTWLWGPIGLVLSTPLTACLVVLGRFVPRLEFLRILLGDEPVLDPDVTYYQRLLARDQDEATDLVEDYLRDHPADTVYDVVLLPASVLAKRDRERGALTSEDEQFVLQVTREILDDLVSAHRQNSSRTTPARPTGSTETVGAKTLVIGCPARDQIDELALHMFGQLLEPTGCAVEALSAATLAAEMLSQVQEEDPAVVCVPSLPPGGLAHTRYLCKRLRAQFPALKILVGRWGLTENVERVREALLSAGADHVVTTLVDARA